MIVSASRRTDIPAFYGEWFRQRFAAGSCTVLNPFNRRPYGVPLRGPGVDGYVFWTKNLGPFLPVLDLVAGEGLPFVVQYTMTGLPRALERSVIPTSQAIAHLRTLRDRWGPRAAVWRFDPIVIADPTPPEEQCRRFAALAGQMRGVVDEVTVSFVQPYRKATRNLDIAATAAGIRWHDPPLAEKRALLAALADIAAAHDMALTVCSQPELSGVPGVGIARCVDAERLSAVAGHAIAAPEKGSRPGCHCAASRDIGAYDTCPHGCAYCYAVSAPETAKRRYHGHAPGAETLSSRGGKENHHDG